MKNNTKPIKVFLSKTSSDVQQQHQLLMRVLDKAGMDVFQSNDTEQPEELLNRAQCSIHLIGKSYEAMANEPKTMSVVEKQFQLAQDRRKPDSEFKIFVWQPWSDNDSIDERQTVFMNTVRNSIMQNMVYSKHESPVLFVEDIRSMMQMEQKNKHKTKSTDVFLIHNELDEESGKEIGSLLSDIMKVERLSLEMQSGMDNADFVVEQILKSKLAVVYFEKTIDWAIPFVQQVWRKIGGASSSVEILLIGEANVAANEEFEYEAPKVHPYLLSKELVPLEIKVQFDNFVKT